MVLGLFLRKAPEPEPAAPAPPPAAKAPPLPPPPRMDSGDDGTGELSVARRQGSQVNLNRLLGAAPHGLNAILKKSTMDSDPAAGSPFTPTPPSQPPSYPQQQLLRGDGEGGGVDAPRGTGRERRRSMTISEMVANMNNIHVGQAAMIMMPQRARQELGGGGADAGSNQAPGGQRSRAPAPQAGESASALGSGAALAGMRGLERQPSVIREAMKMQQSQSQQPQQPQQQQQQAAPPAQLSSPQVHSNSYSRSSAHHSHSHHYGHSEGLPSANLAQLAAALAGQGPAERAPAATRPGERRASMLLLQHSLGSVASGGGGSNNSRSSATGGPGTGAQLGAGGATSPGAERSGPLVPQPPAAGGGSVRRSDPGENFRMRALAPPQPNPMEVVINNVRGLNRSWNAGEAGGGNSASGGIGGGGNSASGGVGGISHSGSGGERQHQFGGGVAVGMVSSSNSHGHGHGQGHGQSQSARDMRSRGMRGSYSGAGRGPGGGTETAGNTEDGEARSPSVSAHATAAGGTGSDLKLPIISSALPRVRPHGDASNDGRGALPGLPGGAARGQLSQAEVAAITEALAAQQNDAARLRAAALRKMDTRIKRTVMERHLLVPEDSGGGGDYGDYGDSNAYGSSNGLTPSKLSPQAHAPRSPLNRPVGVQPHMSAAESAVARAKARLLETEQETAEELNQLRKNSTIGPNGLLPNGRLPADLLLDPMPPPPRGRR
ncbi:hypothetical protein HYH02_007709 [Chlamydomonas schloesseri]|uniref:Uncharacterized protein n=1 Tax=Chlamydomonas schloesseri TaxID=2026947 RepID=A0A836B4E4_9CHLO|nr:hypothetical protein HYH02_007709 [Chlamydomonas schloesseri]|eukprot:KAG2447381.1 hypothetical protein HYH02_007709 [Chlamydomonas schloesseri]